LAGRWASQRILVTGKLADGSLHDVDAGSGRRGEHTGQHRRQEAEIARHGEGRARDARVDGTIVPSAAGGSLAFLPGPALRGLKNINKRYGSEAWSRYRPVNAFNPLKK